MKETKLKPCPFCVGEAEIRKSKNYGFVDCVHVYCATCGASIPKTPINHLFYVCGKQVSLSEEQAIARVTNIWNRRSDNEQREAD